MQAVTDMMACDKMHARIPVATCAGRQMKGISVGRDKGRFVYSIPYECRDCETGLAALSEIQRKTKKEKTMGATKACANCDRVMTIVGDGCCWVCYKTGKGLSGEKKAEALAEIKRKIESGRLKKSGGSGRRKAAPKAPAPSPAKTDKRKRACVNCGRVRFIYRADLCGLCCRAANDLVGDERAAALVEIKKKIENSEIGVGKRRSPAPKSAPAAPAVASTRRKAFRQMIGDDDIAAAQRLPKGFARVPEGVPVIAIDFPEERDRKIYDALIAWAARLRRTPEQQILWMLQNAIEQETGLLAEASGR